MEKPKNNLCLTFIFKTPSFDFEHLNSIGYPNPPSLLSRLHAISLLRMVP